jgi:ribonuclease VapC
MVVDSSVIVAILMKESDAAELLDALTGASDLHLSAANYLEVVIVLLAKGRPALKTEFDQLLANLTVTRQPVTPYQADLAAHAYRTYGKGRHRAALNFGDCFAYALAKHLDAPLLYKGSDFSATDIQPATG